MRETRCFSILSHYQKKSSDGCYLSVLDSAHSTVGDTCLFISESQDDGVSERCLSLKVAISLFALCFSVSFFLKIITLSYLLVNVNILTALKFNGISACLSIELDLSSH